MAKHWWKSESVISRFCVTPAKPKEIKLMRERTKFSLAQFSAISGVPLNLIKRVERGLPVFPEVRDMYLAGLQKATVAKPPKRGQSVPLDEIRKRMGMSVAALSRKSGVHERTIARAEQGRLPTLPTQRKILAALELPFHRRHRLFGKPPPKPVPSGRRNPTEEYAAAWSTPWNEDLSKS